MSMQLDYFYGGEADQFSFYRIPKVLFSGGNFKGMGIEAKVLYGLMLDRMSLSIRNGWLDEKGRVYIYYTLEDAIDMIGYGHNKVVRMFKELETIGLIERKKQGLGKPTMIYVKNFIPASDKTDPQKFSPASGPSGQDTEAPEDETPAFQADVPEESQENHPLKPTNQFPIQEVQTSQIGKSGHADSSFLPDGEVQTSEMGKPRLPKNGSLDFPKGESNKTDNNNTEVSDTDYLSSPPIPPARPEVCGIAERGEMDSMMDEMELYRELIQENIEYEILVHDNPHDADLIDGYVELMVESCCTRSGDIRVNKQYLPAAVVKSRFLKLTREHITYVMDCMKKNTTRIGNIKAYMLSALYNAPVTMDQYYTSLVSYDNAQRTGSG